VLSKITVEYHETLSAAAGFQAEEAKQAAMKKYAGQYVLVVEGAISTKDDGVYCTVGGRSSLDLLKEAAAGAAAVIATGNCATFGGLPRANPNPTGALGVMDIIKDKPVVNISGCPAIPEVFTGTLAHFLVFGSLPELDSLHRPKTFYSNTIHDRCLRRPFYDAGKYALSFDDEGARQVGACISWVVKAPLPIIPAPPSNGAVDFHSRSNPGIPAWAVPNPISGMAADSTRGSLPHLIVRQSPRLAQRL